ncbi:metallophosphoesterase family protein [Roseovarius aquimarinus]|uniref:Metallophosphoesterase family protein n=1 Tax=Roseovarius aquimarinus TaxID=1229156 RepID=A0ABW7I9P1_9RHOB
MRILSFSDLHRDRQAARAILRASADADVVVGAGDFASKGIGAAETLEILADCAAPVLVVHGNHDVPSEIAAFCEASARLTYLHGSGVDLDGVSFFGLGGEVPGRKGHAWNVAHSEVEASLMLADCPERAVLVTHTPPLGTADVQTGGAHEGSRAIRDAILASNAPLCLCGHVHASWGVQGQLGRALVRNLGPGLTWFDI